MSLPNFSKTITKNIQAIKTEIKKLMPPKELKEPEPKDEDGDKEKNKFRNTISHFVNIVPQKVDFNCNNVFQLSQTHKEFNSSKSMKSGQMKFKKKASEEPQTEFMLHWRQEMMNHIRPQRILKVEDTQGKRDRDSPFIFNKMVEQTRAQTSEKKIFKVRSPQTKIKAKIGFKEIPQTSSSQKNLIIIRPTAVSVVQKRKQVSKPKKNIFKASQKSPLDKFFEKKMTQFDQITLQRIANFQALLPFLGTQRASVQKPDKKWKNIYDAEASIKKANVKEKRQRKSPVVLQKITGWQIGEMGEGVIEGQGEGEQRQL